MISQILTLPLRALAACFALCCTAQADTFTVTTAADEFNTPSGTNLSLREAVRDAAEVAGADIINFNPSLFGQTATLASGEISLNSALTLDASALQGGVTVAGTGTGRLLNIGASGDVTLVGLTFTGGNVGGGAGGAILSAGGSSLRIVRCTFSGNHANEGGAILNSGSLLVENSTFSGNTSGFGGALQCRDLTTLTHCTFSGNNGYFGGAIYNNTTTLSVNNSIIAGNTAGGGIRDILSQSAALVFTNANLVQSVTPSTAAAPISGPAPLTHPPLLAPLGNYGGPTQTMPPLFGSPAIDAAVGSSSTTDQRGFTIAGRADIGAVENGSLVTTGLDQLDTPSGAEVSLREAVRDCPTGGVIGFASALSGGTCVLTTALGGEIVLNKSVTIDASSQPNGITIDGGAGTNRIFSIPAGQTVTLNRLNLAGGGGTGATQSGRGGAIYNSSSLLTLTHCSFQGNSANDGGGIYNHNSSSPTLTNCSFQGNSASSNGGGIYNFYSPPTLNNCSFQGNSASSKGGGIYNFYSSPTLNNCILWRNQDGSGTGTANSSVFKDGGAPSYSHCLIQGLNPGGTGNLDGTLFSNDPLFVLEVDPSLAPTTSGNLRFRPGSPAIDAGDNTKNTTTTDLAGDTRFSGIIDLGAYERSAPILSPVTIATTGNTGWAKPGNTVTLTFIANEPIQTPVVTMCGETTTVNNASGNIWTASVIVNGGTTEGVASFSISATDLKGSIGAPVTATTDGSAVKVDRTQPILTAPGDMIVDVSAPQGVTVSFTAGTSDNLDPAPVLVSTPPSGSLFPIGETTVNLSLTDAAGNASVGSFKVTVQLLSTGKDTDGDGLNDLAEFQMSTLGFDWQVSQPALVNTLMTNANTAGLFTSGQVQTLHVGTPLISQVSPGRFRLTLGVQKSTNLTNPFTDFSLTGPDTTTEFTDGKLKFEFPATDNAAFYRIETE